MNPTSKQMRNIAWLLAAAALLLVLELHLLPSLLAGLLVHELVRLIAPPLQRRISSARGKLIAVALLAVMMVGATAAAVVGALAFFRSDAGSLARLFGKMAQIIEDARASMPPWLPEYLPQSGDSAAGELQTATADWLRHHAAELGALGKEAGRALAHILVGIIIGAMVVTREAVAGEALGPLAAALAERARRIADAFRRIVFAQVRISLLNTVFTALYLAAVLPLFGVQLPLTKTLIAVTFVAGMLPVIGNLISNTIVVIVYWGTDVAVQQEYVPHDIAYVYLPIFHGNSSSTAARTLPISWSRGTSTSSNPCPWPQARRSKSIIAQPGRSESRRLMGSRARVRASCALAKLGRFGAAGQLPAPDRVQRMAASRPGVAGGAAAKNQEFGSSGSS